MKGHIMKRSTFSLRPALSALAIAVATASAGCAATSDHMREVASAEPPAAPAGSATVIFVRPSGYAGGIKTTILDEHGGFLGDSLPESQFSVAVPAGKHLFVSWAENTGALQADLAAGKTYYVEVAPRMGAFSARVHLLAVTPRTKSWAKLPEWLRESRHYVPDPRSGQAYLASRQDDVKERLRRAGEAIRGYDADDLALRTLNPGDGR
jgi:hypothetical protein